MPKLTIDDRKIEVASKTMVIEAAAQLGIMIPRFCYHPALGSVGACRVCAVKFVEGPLKGIQMSCMVEAQDGMVVSTTDAEAVDFRKHVIEWLMLNHPHDCPVCDEGGHCLLQDMTVSGGHGIRRYAGPKRTYIDQYLGPLVQHEMNRCIHCYRCARFYQEFAGYRDLGVMQNANRTFYGRFEDGILESPFSGNLSDICPTGVYTDKPSRYFGRRWDYQRTPSLCINCSLGCRTVASVRYREVKRLEARFSEEVNGYFICDRGRYGFLYASLESRPRRALIDGKPVPYGQALQAATERLDNASRHSGSSAIAALESTRSSLETQAMLRYICQSKGWRNPAYFKDPETTSKVKTSIARLEPELTVSLREVEKADFILCVAADPINEAPMLAMAMRQAQRAGAKVVVMDPRPVSLPMEFDHLAVAVEDLSDLTGLFINATADRKAVSSRGGHTAKFFEALPNGSLIKGYPQDLFDPTIEGLKTSLRPIIVCGTDIISDQVPALAADLVVGLRASGKNAGLFYLLPGTNAFGAGILSEDKASWLDVIEAVETGDVKALIVVEADPYFHFPDRKRLERALDALDLLVVIDYLNSDIVQNAHIFIPATTLYEMDGIFVNQEGRAQIVQEAFRGGLPIVQSGGGNHPPRIYGSGIPEDDYRPAWQTLARFSDGQIKPKHQTLPATVYQGLADIVPELADINVPADIPDEGLRLDSGQDTGLRFTTDLSSRPEAHQKNSGELKLILTDLTFGTEVLSAYSECLWQLEQEPSLIMHASDAQSLDLRDGDTVSIQTQGGMLTAKLRVVENMAAGMLVVPRHRKMAWQVFEPGMSSISRNQIKKVPSE